MKRVTLVLAAMLAACSAPAPIDTSAQVATFHQLLDKENYTAIWQGISDDMRGASTEAEMNKLFTVIHHKLGRVVQTKQIGWRTNMTTNGTFAEVQIETKFEKGAGQENFVFRQDGERLKLAGYHINSNDMMMN